MRTEAKRLGGSRGIVIGLVAAWVKALTEPRLQAATERILPPSPAQKQEVGADPAGRPENMPPAVLAERMAVALGHGGLTVRQRLRLQNVIHYGTGAGARDRLLRRRGPLARGEPGPRRARRAGDLRGHPRLAPPRARGTTAAVAAGAGRGRLGIDLARGVRHRAGGHATRS